MSNKEGSRETSSDDKNPTSNNDEHDEDLADLHPPQSWGEQTRDAMLRALESSTAQYINIVVILGVIISGAIFFFFLMGWQTLCQPRTDCQPRNDIYNISIQILNVFFTYMSTVAMPWRWAHWLHTTGWSCPHRSNAPGKDLYGRESDNVWFQVPLGKRVWVLVVLLLNALTQYANQATRIVYYNYELSNEFPGNLWTNIFFGASMLCAAVGGGLFAYFSEQERVKDPERFGLSPKEQVQDLWTKVMSSKETTTTSQDANQ